MSVVHFSDFRGRDERWKTRYTPRTDMREGEVATWKDDRLQLRLKKVYGEPRTTHLALMDQSFTFGRFSARMRFLGPPGAHSSFWLQDVDDVYGPNGSEVDVIEHFGSNVLWQNVYWRNADSPPWPYKEKFRTKIKRYTHNLNVHPGQWNTYTVDWLPDKYVFYINGVKTSMTRQGLSSRPKVPILSYLCSDFERPKLQLDKLSVYKTEVNRVKIWDLDGIEDMRKRGIHDE